MTAAPNTNDVVELREFPGSRDPRCPFDPPPRQARWWEGEGLGRSMWSGSPLWVVTRHEDIREVLADQRFSADFRRPDFPGWTPANAHQPPTFPRMDDPEHARLRRMLTKDFTVKQVELKRPQIQQIVDEHLEQMIGKGAPVDLVHDFALPIPSLVISLMLGVPYEDHPFFQQHSHTVTETAATPEEKGAAQAALFGFLLDLVARKEKEPSDDIISRLLAEQVAIGELTREAVAMAGTILLIAGHETTANMLGLGTLALLENPDQAARLRDTDDPKLVANAVEELMRYLTIIQDGLVRVAKEDVAVGGQLVRAGEGVIMSLPAGNRDTSVFTDPDRFDIGRANARTSGSASASTSASGRHWPARKCRSR